MNIQRISPFLVALSLACGPAFGGDGGIYVGGGAVASMFDRTADDVLANANAGGITGSVGGFKDTSVGLKVYAGYQMTRHIGIEAAYNRLGKSESVVTATRPSAARVPEELKASGISGSLVGTFPVNPKFSILARAGFFYWNAEGEAPRVAGGAVGRGGRDETGFDVTFGIGTEVEFGNRLAARVELERFQGVDDVDVNAASASLLYRF